MAEIKRLSESGTFLNAQNHLKDALETTSIAASRLKNVSDLLRAPDYQSLLRDTYRYEPLPYPDVPPNPIY